MAELPRQSDADEPQPVGAGFSDFTLAELQLLSLALWILGDRDQVDYRLMADYRGLVARLRSAMTNAVARTVENG